MVVSGRGGAADLCRLVVRGLRNAPDIGRLAVRGLRLFLATDS